MSVTIIGQYQQDWACSGIDSTMILGQGGILYVGDRMIDTATVRRYRITGTGTFDSPSQTYTGVNYVEDVTDDRILAVIAEKGWNVNTSRSYSQRTSPAFNTSYAPSSTNDTQVQVSISLTSTVLTAATVDIEVDSGSGFVTIAQLSLSGLAATATQLASFLVPAGASYKLVQSSGTSLITSIYEVNL